MKSDLGVNLKLDRAKTFSKNRLLSPGLPKLQKGSDSHD
jgi:hypothetical protein